MAYKTGVVFSKNCPHCGERYAVSNDLPYPNDVGQTEKVCKNCKKKFIDHQAFEWENLTDLEKKNYLICGHIYPKEIVFIGLKKYISQAKSFKYDKSMLNCDEIKESIERTSSKEYREKMIEIGRTFYGIDIVDDSGVSNISYQKAQIAEAMKQLK